MIELPEKALSLWQPYAWLVAAGHKPIENRKKAFNQRRFRGPFWIHASEHSPRTPLETDRYLARHTEVEALAKSILGPDFTLPDWCDITFGAIIGRAVITGILEPKGHMFHKPDVPWHFPDQYGFIIENAVLLEKPVPCKGALGFWKVPEPVLAELRSAA